MSEIKVHRLEKQIIRREKLMVLPMTYITVIKHETLVSYDGVTWALDAGRHKTRFNRAVQLHKEIAKKSSGRIQAEVHSERSVADPVILPVSHTKQSLLGRDRGKKKFRKARVPNVLKIRPAHYHRCHVVKFVCCCEFKWKRRKCGGEICLYSLNPAQIIQLIKELRRGRSN